MTESTEEEFPDPQKQFDFDELEKTYFLTKQPKVQRDFSKEILLSKKVIALQNNPVNSVLYSLAIQAKKSGTKIDGPQSLLPIPLHRNVHYFYSVFVLNELGLVDPSASLLRTIYETILATYLVYLTGHEAELYFKKETNKLSPAEETELRNKFRYLSPAVMRDILFSSTKSTKLKNFYEKVSWSSHSSIKGFLSNVSYTPNVVKDRYQLLLSLSIANVMCILEFYEDKLNDTEKNKINETLGPLVDYLGGVTDLVPDSQILPRQPRIQPQTFYGAISQNVL